MISIQKINIMLLLTMLLVVNSGFVFADEGVDITDSAQVSELRKLQKSLDAVSTAVMSCMDSGVKHGDCMCKHQNLIIQFNNITYSVFSNNPSFETIDIIRFKQTDGTWISQSLKGMRKQANTALLCPY